MLVEVHNLILLFLQRNIS